MKIATVVLAALSLAAPMPAQVRESLTVEVIEEQSLTTHFAAAGIGIEAVSRARSAALIAVRSRHNSQAATAVSTMASHVTSVIDSRMIVTV